MEVENIKKYCSENCDFLCKEYNCCTKPTSDGKAKRLVKDGNNKYIRICASSSCKNGVSLSPYSVCNLACPHLIENMGCCIRPELKGRAKILKKVIYDDGHGGRKYYLKECNLDFTSTEKPKKKNKYRAKKITVNGIEYDSKLEYERYCELKILEQAKKISKLEYHVRFPLIDKDEHGREIAYEADFVYIENGQKVVEDVKSKPTKTRLYALKKRLLLERYGIKIKEYMKE